MHPFGYGKYNETQKAMHTKTVVICVCVCGVNNQLGVEQKTQWKLDRSGSQMEVEIRWKWMLDGSES